MSCCKDGCTASSGVLLENGEDVIPESGESNRQENPKP